MSEEQKEIDKIGSVTLQSIVLLSEDEASKRSDIVGKPMDETMPVDEVVSDRQQEELREISAGSPLHFYRVQDSDFQISQEDYQKIIQAREGKKHTGGLGIDIDTPKGEGYGKIISSQSMTNYSRDYSLQEMRIHGNVEHPNIVPLYGLSAIPFPDGTYDYVLVMKKVDPLSMEVIDAMTPQDALQMATEIGEALDYLEKEGIEHGDITINNIGRDLKTGKFMLFDFGVSRGTVDSWKDKKINSAGYTGNRSYGAPEVMNDRLFHQGGTVNEVLHPKADQHALAVVIYQVLTGGNTEVFLPHRQASHLLSSIQKEFHHLSEDQRLNKHPKLSDATYQVLSKATSFDPSERFASCEEFAKALRDSIENSNG